MPEIYNFFIYIFYFKY